MGPSLRGRVVVITGGSSGIGLAAAVAFGRAGAHVVIAARHAERLDDARGTVEATGARCLAVTTDVSREEQVDVLLGATLEHFGGVDVWVNNAGYGMVASVEHTTPAEMRAIFDTNYMGAFYGCRAALRQMRRQGRGHIVNVSSLAGRYALPLNSAYAATKHAMNALGQALGAELDGSSIRVTTVMPSLTETGFFSALIDKTPGGRRSIVRAMPAERVADAIVRTVVRPRSSVVFAPGGRLTLALAEAFPAFYRVVARMYLRARTDGKGTPDPPV